MKINRMFEMIYILLYKKTVSANEFAEYFDVSTRTIYRYVDELSASNVPIYMKKGKNGGIALLPDYTLNQTMLSSKNKQEILGALHAFYALKPEDNQETIHKLNGIFQNTSSSWLEVDFSYWHSNTINADTFDKIQTAILNYRKIKFQYYDSHQNETTRTVQPLKLIYKAMDWYVYAFCELREEYRFFKIKRMRNLTITEVIFSNHLEININDALPSSQKKDKEIKLRFSKELLNIVIEEFSDFVFDDNGDILITVLVESYEQSISWILSYGHYCTVLYPNQLIEMILKECKKTLKNYS